jgi:signal transduction histidine kinase/streptogramin lyase
VDRIGAVEDSLGGIWIFHYGRGLFHARPDGRERKLTAEDNFPGDRVDCFLQDREGNLWAGVDRGGLVRLREKRFQVVSFGDGSTPKAAISVCEDEQHAIWVGTFGAGLNRWQAGVATNFDLPGAQQRGFVFSVFPASSGRLWLSLGEEDLFVREGERIRPVTPTIHGVKVILIDHRQRVWVGTKAALYVGEGGQFRALQAEDGIRRTGVRALAEDAQGVIWAGGGDGTLYRIEADKTVAFRPTDSLASQPIWSLHADDDGTIWAGTFRGGLLSFKNDRFTRFTSKDGLPDDVICQILDDHDGQLWIGSHQGIFRVAKSALHTFESGREKTVACTAYGRYDGLPTIECSGGYQPAAWRASDGRLWFATLKGVVSVRPDELKPNEQPPPVVIEETLVDGQPETPKIDSHRTGRGPAVSGLRLILSPGKRRVDFRFTGLSLVSPDRVRFRYKLDGLETDWVEAGAQRTAQYSYLKPGDYTFRVTACNNDGVWNAEGAAMRVTVRPRFYEIWEFRALVALLVFGSIVAVVRHLATRRLREQLERLERQRAVERDRTRIAKDIHDDLGAGLTQITLLSELARRDPPTEVRSHLGQISESARDLTRAMDEIVWAVNPHNDTLDGLATYVSKFTQEYLNVAGIRCRLDLPPNLPPQPLRPEVRHNLFLAVKETVNNIVKHAQASEVHLCLELHPAFFAIIIEDNGQGMAAGGAPGSDGQGLRFSSGHGLGNLQRRLTSIGGRCLIQSEPGKGTRVELTVQFETGSPPSPASPGG